MIKRYIVTANGWYVKGPREAIVGADTCGKHGRRVFYTKANALSWIAYREQRGLVSPGYWQVRRLVKRKPQSVEIFGTVTGTQWVSEDATYGNLVTPFLAKHAGKRIKVRYEIC